MGGAAGGSGDTGPTYYRLKDAVVNSASIDFDIDGIRLFCLFLNLAIVFI